MTAFGYLPKLKRSLGLAFGAHFRHDFFHKNVSYLILYLWTKFQCHTFFPSQDMKQNVLLSFYLDIDDVINFKIYLRSSPKAMADREKKMGGQKNQNLDIPRTKRAF